MRAWRFLFAARRSLLFSLLLPALWYTGVRCARSEERGASAPRVERILVPKDSPGAWPAGDWQLERRSKIEALLKSAEPTASSRPKSAIRRATYSAVLAGESFTSGRMNLTLERMSEASEFVSLAPLNIHASSFTWGDDPAIWGTGPKSGTVVLMDRVRGTLSGQWSLHGARRSHGVDFDFRVPRAVTSRLSLRLPREFRLRADVGVVTTGPAKDAAGWQVWDIELGRRTRCRLAVDSGPAPVSRRPLIFVEKSVTNLVAVFEQFRVLCDLNLTILEAPLERLELLVDHGTRIHSVMSGTDDSFPLEETEKEGIRHVVVRFNPPLQGTGHLLHVHASAPLPLDRQTPLPRIRVSGGAAIGYARLNLSVTGPLQLKKFTASEEYLEVDPIKGGDAVSLQSYGVAGDVTAVLGWPQPDVRCRVFSRLDPVPDQWKLRTWMLWRCRTGKQFSLRCLIPAAWDIISLRLGHGTGLFEGADWRIVLGEHGVRTLVVNLDHSLSTEQPVVVKIEAIRSPPTEEEAVAIPAPVPLGAHDVETLFSITTRNGAQPVLEPGGSFEQILANSVPGSWKQLELWKNDSDAENQSPFFLLSTTNQPAGKFYFQSEETALNVAAEINCALSDGRVVETFRLSCNTAGADVPKVHVFITEPGPAIDWRLVGEHSAPLKSRKLPTSRHRLLDLPPSGELWEIQFPAALAANFELIGDRVRPFPADGRAGFVFVPRTQSFQGQITVVVEPGILPRFESRGLVESTEISVGNTDTAPGDVYRWKYTSKDAALQVSTQSRSKTSQPLAIVAAGLRSQMSPKAGGDDIHWAVYDLRAFPKTAEFAWKMPAQAQLISVHYGGQTYDGQTIKPLSDGEFYRLPPRLDDRTTHATIHYRTPSMSWLGWKAHRLPLPEVNVPVLRFEWELALPPDTYPSIDDPNADITDGFVSSIWWKRFFGPFHKARRIAEIADEKSGLNANNPSAGHLFAGNGSPPQSLAILSGWRVWKISFSKTPRALKVILWDRQQSKLAASALLILCLLTALGLRSWGVTLSRRGAVVWLVFCMTIAVAVPTAYAEIAGGLVMGSLLACLLPLVEKSLFSRTGDQSVPIPEGSTRKFLATGAGCLLAAICCWGQADVWGQETATGRPRQGAIPAAALRLLIPYESGDVLGEKSEWSYIERAALKKLEDLALESGTSQPPAYLLSAAEYDLNINEQAIATCRSRFTVDVLSSAEEVEVHLPLSSTSLVAGDACRVNGQPHAAWNASDGSGLVLHLGGLPRGAGGSSAPGAVETGSDHSTDDGSAVPVSAPPRAAPRSLRYLVEISTYVPVDQTVSRQRTRFQIPRVVETRLSVHVPSRYPHVQVRGDDMLPIEMRRSVDEEPQSILIGNVRRIEVSWAATLKIGPLLESVFTCLLKVSPSLVQYHVRARYRISDGAINRFSWKLPVGVAVRSISGSAVAGYRIPIEKDGRRGVQIDLDGPQSGSVEIDAEFLLPVKIQDEQLVVPVLDLLPDSGRVEGDHHRYVIGITAPKEFRLALTKDGGSGMERLRPEDFTSQWAENTVAPPIVLDIIKQTEIKIGIRPLAPVRQVTTVFRGRISSRVLQWELRADMNVREALAFQHRLQVDPRLRIETISVQQEDAERLRRWTQTSDQLVLFLKTGAIGLQKIRITGSMPLKFPSEFSLPSIGFFDATLTDAEVILTQDADISVTLRGADKFSQDLFEKSPSARQSGQLPVVRFKIPASADVQELRIRTAENSPRIVMDSLNILDMRAGSPKLTTLLYFHVLQGHASAFTVRVPRQYEETYEVDSPDLPQKVRGDDGLELIFPAETPGQREFTVRLTIPIELAEDGSLTLDEIAPLNAKRGERFLLTLSEDEGFGPAAQFSGLTDRELSSNLIDRIPEDLSLDLPRSYQGAPGPWRLQSGDRPKAEARIVALSDTRLWLNGSRVFGGQTTFLIMPCNEEKFVVTLPVGAKLQTALIDGDRPAVTSTNGQTVTVSLDAAQVGQVVTLYWSIPASDRPVLWNLQVACRAPWPQGFTVDKTLLAVLPSKDMILSPTVDTNRGTSLAYSLSRLEAEFELLRAQTNAGHTQQQRLWQRFLRHRRQLADRFAHPSAVSILGRSRLQATFAKLESRVNSYTDQTDISRDAGTALIDASDRDEVLTALSLPPGSLFYISSEDGIRSTGERVWVVDVRLFYALVAVVAVSLLVVGRRFYRRYIGWKGLDWLFAHPRVAWSVVGLGWWLFLAQGWIGLVVIAAAILSRLLKRSPEAAETTEVDFVVVRS